MNKCLALMIVAGLTACTTTDDIIVDRKGVDPAKYQQDLAECQGYSSEVKTGEKAARGAGAGAVSGAASGVSEGSREEVQVVKQCLRGRGYKVLN